MSFLRALFGPTREEIWHELCRQIGAQYSEGGFFHRDKVQAHVGDWIITMDLVHMNKQEYTRIRAPFINQDGFTFTIRRGNIFSELGKLFGMEDIEIGDPSFDREFIIQSKDHDRIRQLLSNPRIRQMIQMQSSFNLEIRDDEGWFGVHFPEGVDELHFLVPGVIKDLDQLRALYELFAEVLNQLCHMDSAYEDDVFLHIETLCGPGGRIESGCGLLWEGDSARRRAAQYIGEKRDQRGFRALVSVLDDSDHLLRSKAAWALGRIGNTHAVPHLIPLMADTAVSYVQSGGAVTPPEQCAKNLDNSKVAWALNALGQGPLVTGFYQALAGVCSFPIEHAQKHRNAILGEFIKALHAANSGFEIHAAKALADLHAIEALPDLHKVSRRFHMYGFEGKAHADVLDEAIARLESLAALPRSSKSADTDSTADLPRAPRSEGDDTAALPRASNEKD